MRHETRTIPVRTALRKPAESSRCPSAQPRALEESGSVIWRLRRGGTTHFPDLARRTADVFDLTEEAIEVDVAVFVEPLPRGELLGR